MNNFMNIPDNIHYKIISYLYPNINYLKLINKKFLNYVHIILKKGRIKNIDDVVEFSHIKFKKIIDCLDKHPHYKHITLNYVNNCINVCQLIKHTSFSDTIISISNSNIYIEKEIHTHKLYINNCKITNGIDIIKIKNTKYFICEKLYISTNTLTLELSNVDFFEYTNNSIFCNLFADMKTIIKMNNCRKFNINNKREQLLLITHKGLETYYILKNN